MIKQKLISIWCPYKGNSPGESGHCSVLLVYLLHFHANVYRQHIAFTLLYNPDPLLVCEGAAAIPGIKY